MRALAAALCCTIVSAAVFAPPVGAATSVFDPPLGTQKLTLPAAFKGSPKTKLTCRTYAHFMVKQIDEGEVGAAQLSMIPIDAAHPKPACQRKNVASEKVVDAKDWGGYFKGVKGDYVFFDAEDGVNGGLGFAIFGIDAKKLFEDSALGDLEAATLDGKTLTLRYKRSFSGDCSVPHDGAGCWTKIAAAIGQGAAPQPDCAGGYLKAKNELAKDRCEAQKKSGPGCLAAALKEIEAQKWDEAPSVIIYAAETVLGSGQPTTRSVGAPLSCHPSD